MAGDELRDGRARRVNRERVVRTLTFWLRPEFVLRVVNRFQKVAGFDRAIALASEFRREGARDDRQRDEGRERSRGQRDRAVESRELLKPVDDAEHELGPQPERERPYDTLAMHAPPLELGGIVTRHG